MSIDLSRIQTNPTPFRSRDRVLLSILSGVLLGFAFPPTGWIGGLLAFFALVPLLIALRHGTRLRDAFESAWIAMFVLGLIATYWVGGWKSGSEADPFLMLGGVLLAIVHPFFLMIPYLMYDVMRRRISERAALWALPVFMAGFEYWHSFGDLSFPWLSLYDTQTYNLAFVQFIAWTGPFALSMLIVQINIELLRLFDRRHNVRRMFPPLVALAALIGIPYCYGAFALASPEPTTDAMRMTVIQPNIDPWAKWQEDNERVLDTNFAESEKALAQVNDSTELLIWPETAITFFIRSPENQSYLRRLQSYIAAKNIPLLSGFPDREIYNVSEDSIPPDAHQTSLPGVYSRSWNAAMLYYQLPDRAFRMERYHKQKLVPLGEHVPFVEDFPILGKFFQWEVGLGSWNYGEGYEPLRMPIHDGRDTLAITPLICYESVYPSFVRHFVNNGANVLAVITNDGWYGKSSGPYQHEQFAKLRAIENRRWVARSANTGISTFIDDHGRTHGALPLFVDGGLTARVPLITTKTFYTSYGDFIAIPALILSAIALAFELGLWMMRRKKPTTPLEGTA